MQLLKRFFRSFFLLKIALRSVQQRGLASLLTAFSMALGIMLVVAVLAIHGVIYQSFHTNTFLGYNIIVGAKGGKLQLTLNSVYYLSQPVENIPYDYYLEFKDPQTRERDYQFSLAHYTAELQRSVEQFSYCSAVTAGGSSAASLHLAASLAFDNVRQSDNKAAKPGRFGLVTELAIPLCLGDYYGRFRVVGTTSEMFDKLSFGADGKRKYKFDKGRNFQRWNAQHGYFEAVVGAAVADEKQMKLDDQFSPAHGDPDGHGHDRKFTVVGILDRTGTPNDRAVFVNIEGFYLMTDHAKPIAVDDEEETSVERKTCFWAAIAVSTIAPTTTSTVSLSSAACCLTGSFLDAVEAGEVEPVEVAWVDDQDLLQPLPIEQREVTAILVRTVDPIVAVRIPTLINEGAVAQAVLPTSEIYSLFETIVQPILRVLVLLTGMICVVSGVSILVSIYNSMSDRRHEIAVMRALGARRGTVLVIVLWESILLSMGGGLMGWCMGHGLVALASSRIEAQTGVAVGFFDLAPTVNLLEMIGVESPFDWLQQWLMISPELLLIPFLISLAIVVGLIPGLAAYRTDVAKSLGK